mgnify:CR=1 FL=1
MKECNHPTCLEVCRRQKKVKKKYVLKRTQPNPKHCKINPVSARRKKESKIYKKERILFLSSHLTCEINSPICTYEATVIHHKKGREGSLYLDTRYWAASCWNCNGYVEVNDEWAGHIEHYLQSRRDRGKAFRVLDARRGWLDKDLDLKMWLEANGWPYVVVASRMDKLNQSEQQRGLKAIRQYAEPLPFSAVTGRGVREIWQAITKTHQ